MTELRAGVAGGSLGGWVRGDGPPVLLLHGGPGLSYEYLDALADEIGDGYRIAAYQQRGLAPSTAEGPFDIATAVADARRRARRARPGTAPGWSATRGAGTCSCTSRPRCRSACTAASPSTRSAAWGTAGRPRSRPS